MTNKYQTKHSDKTYQKSKCAIVALIGEPNVGKSTFVNQMVGAKISIVTHKAQTTRMNIRAIISEKNAQLIFIDTPGLFNPKRTLDQIMIETAWKSAKHSDHTILIVDARHDINTQIMRKLEIYKNKTILLINKIDLIAHQKLLPLIEDYRNAFPFNEIFMISALKGKGCAEIKSFLQKNAPTGPWLYPPEYPTDMPKTIMAAEMTRQQIYLRVHNELPYAASVETVKWTTLKNKEIHIEQIIYVERQSHKPIIIGHKGANIKEIGKRARSEMHKLFGHKVHLFLFVKVNPKWSTNRKHLSTIGFDEDIIKYTQEKNR